MKSHANQTEKSNTIRPTRSDKNRTSDMNSTITNQCFYMCLFHIFVVYRVRKKESKNKRIQMKPTLDRHENSAIKKYF